GSLLAHLLYSAGATRSRCEDCAASTRKIALPLRTRGLTSLNTIFSLVYMKFGVRPLYSRQVNRALFTKKQFRRRRTCPVSLQFLVSFSWLVCFSAPARQHPSRLRWSLRPPSRPSLLPLLSKKPLLPTLANWLST